MFFRIFSPGMKGQKEATRMGGCSSYAIRPGISLESKRRDSIPKPTLMVSIWSVNGIMTVA